MNKLLFYPRLALQNLRKNSRFCLPFLLTTAGCAALFYIMRFLTCSEMVASMKGAAYVYFELELGGIVIGIMVFCLLWYANRFVMKRRERELGLYNILGMQKRQVALVLALENLFTALAGTAAGIVTGIVFSKLVLLALLRLLRMEIPMGFYISGAGIYQTVLLMALIFCLLMAHNLWRLARLRPVELLHSEAVGEREPKSRRLLALAGAACLAGGYGIALTTESPISALMMFFPAVILVIIGTFCLFSAGSVVLLKALRKNRRFYYQPRHFTAVSGLLYRMGQNAKGLSNICILSTMVLVTVSCTVCLYAGTEDSLQNLYPDAISLRYTVPQADIDTADFTGLENAVSQAAADYGCGQGSGRFHSSLRLTITANNTAEGVYALDTNNYVDVGNTALMMFITAEEYTQLTGQPAVLAPDEVLAYGVAPGTRTLRLGGADYRVQTVLETAPVDMGTMEATLGNTLAQGVCVVLADRAALRRVYDLQLAAYGEKRATKVYYILSLNPTADAQGQLACYEAVSAAADAVTERRTDGVKKDYYSCRREEAEALYAMDGSFLFLGLFLGLAFLLATVLIIYYKQVSEGYEDRQRFVILQKVGMSQQEVRAAIRTQVLLVFFLPLLLAALHICMAFPMLSRLLLLFSLTNVPLFAGCTAGTFLVFAAVYVLVYSLTAKQYYRIVRA